jgi:hypothetical protein
MAMVPMDLWTFGPCELKNKKKKQKNCFEMLYNDIGIFNMTARANNML